jgi:hypothetical protein
MSDIQKAVEAALNYIHAHQDMPLNSESVVQTVQRSAAHSKEAILSYMREVYEWNEAFMFDVATQPAPPPEYPQGYRPAAGDYRAACEAHQDDYLYSVWKYEPYVPASWSRPDSDPSQPWKYEPMKPGGWIAVKTSVSEEEYISCLGERRLVASDPNYMYDYWRL